MKKKEFHFQDIPLFLAPMEGIGDKALRASIAIIGGFNEACTEFIRVPINSHIPSLSKQYDPHTTFPIPQAAQIMGYDPMLMADMAKALEEKKAPRIDINCGCPSNIVVGKGAGSGLLKDPNHLYLLVKEIKQSVSIPVTVKMRSGFLDTTLFKENLDAVASAGADFLTLHPRTKLEAYRPPANWDLIAEAKQLLNIPVIGNGDILTVNDAKRMLKETCCDGLMIGRGALINPWIFHEIRADFDQKTVQKEWRITEKYLVSYFQHIQVLRPQQQINKLKALLRYLFSLHPTLEEVKPTLLRTKEIRPQDFMIAILTHLKPFYNFSSNLR